MSYSFPENNMFKARDLLNLEFDIRKHSDANLYVNLDKFRGDEFRNQLYFLLGINENEYQGFTENYTKVIFSGHRGCGKSLELWNIHNYLNDQDRYLSIFVDMEKEVPIAQFEAEDFFITLISKLISEAITEYGLDINTRSLDALMRDWMITEEEIAKEYSLTAGAEASAEAKSEFSFWKWLSVGVGIKTFLTGETKTTRTLREKIKQNPNKLIQRLNELIDEVRRQIRKENLGKDLLFIYDGTEKIRYEIYRKLFVLQSEMIIDLNVNLICAVPINAWYDIQNGVSADAFEKVLLPMFKLTDENEQLFGEIVTRRIDKNTFFDEEALKLIIEKSGGCPRQLLKLASSSLRISLGKKSGTVQTEKAVKTMGQFMFELLDSEHVKILKEGAFSTSDQDIKELLFSLAVLKYNGTRKMNPLLTPFINSAS